VSAAPPVNPDVPVPGANPNEAVPSFADSNGTAPNPNDAAPPFVDPNATTHSAPDAPPVNPNPQPNRGGRPRGTTEARKQARIIDEKKATNWVVDEYAKIASEAKAAGKAKVPNGTLQGLVNKAKEKFEFLDDTFTVSRAVVNKRMQTGRHTVWHRGTPSPALSAEPILVSMITRAYQLNAPWLVSQCKSAMNKLLKDTQIGYFIFLIRIDPNHELIQIENGLYIRFYETPSNREA
jgi:hypothetical protein